MATTVATTVQPHLKRKQSTAGIQNGGRNVKRRASKACHCCRSRKVRCDVVESGMPCTNCRLDEVECLVTEGKRRRKSYVDGDMLAHRHSPPASVEGDKELPLFTSFDDLEGLNDITLSLDGMGDGANFASLEEDQTQGHRMSPQERSTRISTINMRTTTASLPSPATVASPFSYFTPQNKRPEILLPSYIRPVPQSMMTEDLGYLSQRGAFMIPETSLRNELLRCYVQYVHPLLPMLNLQDFLSTINMNEPSDTVSLLLFQAVMFAGTGFIDMRHLLAQGYDTRKAARRAFFQRVKLLYDFDYETDRVTLVQAVLLMSYWYEAPDDSKDIWHWLGIAVSLARTIGINCDTSESGMDLKTRKMWKRVWWCCLLRDRLISLGMRRPLRITETDFELPVLELDDFETEGMPLELSRMLGGCPAVKDSAKRVTLARMCIALIRLCECVTTVLNIQYSLIPAKLGLTKETTLRLVPKKIAVEPSEVMRCDKLLEEWHAAQGADMHFFVPGSSQERTNTNDGEVISLHRSVITGVYLTAVSALHRPQVMPAMPSIVVDPDLSEISRRKVRECANDITEMFKDLYACDMIRYLPNTGVSCLLPALIIHMLDLKSSDTSVRQTASRKFQFCMQSLQRLREMYASADFAFSFLDTAVRRTETKIPSAPMSANQDGNPVVFKKESRPTSPLLTPPPEAAWTANRLLFAATLAPEERKLLATFTPPHSDHSLNSVMTGGAAIALTDLQMSVSEHSDGSEYAESAEELEARQLEQQALNDFDALINLEGNGDAGMYKGVFAEMNMAWLNGMIDHDDEEMFSGSARDEHEVNGGYEEASKADDLEDLEMLS